MADVVTFARKSGGRWAYPVDPDDQEYFGLECADFLPPGVTLANSATGPAGTLDPIVILTEGITALSTVRIQGTQLVVKLTGINVSDDAELEDNCCTFRFYTSTGERFDRSMYFIKKDK
jgi:hypothetical protein